MTALARRNITVRRRGKTYTRSVLVRVPKIANHLYARKAKLGFVGGLVGGVSAYGGGALGHTKGHPYVGMGVGSFLGSTTARLLYRGAHPRITRGYKTASYSTRYHADFADAAGSLTGHAIGFGAAALAHHAGHKISLRWTHGNSR